MRGSGDLCPARRGSIAPTRPHPRDGSSKKVSRTGDAGPRRPREVGVVSAVVIFWIAVAATCCGLCIYGISRAVRRAKERQTEDGPVVTHR
jgi:hypothetical protein